VTEDDLRIEIGTLRAVLAEMRMEILSLRQTIDRESDRANAAERKLEEREEWFAHAVESWKEEEQTWVEERESLLDQIASA